MRVGVQRSEFEYPIPGNEAGYLLDNLCMQPLISKTRHYVHNAGNTWEIDVFDGSNKGLIVAELELDRPDQVFEKPAWLGEEVTDDLRYYNISLVENPYNEW